MTLSFASAPPTTTTTTTATRRRSTSSWSSSDGGGRRGRRRPRRVRRFAARASASTRTSLSMMTTTTMLSSSPWLLSSALLVGLVLLASLPRRANGLPYFLLESHASKCVQVDAPQRMTLQISYDAPDMIESDQENVTSVIKEQLVETERELSSEGDKPKTKEENLDARFNDRFQNKIYEAKNKMAQREMTLLVFQREDLLPGFIPRGTRSNKSGTGKLREQLGATTGTYEFLTGEVDGLVEICLQSYQASKMNPTRVGLNVTMSATKDDADPEEKRRMGEEQRKMVDSHKSRISTELVRMEGRVQDITAFIDSAKEREANFTRQSNSLHRAVRYWPMFRIVILLVAGYLQVNHVVRYMKTRHIY